MNARRGWVRAQERGRVAVARELAKMVHPHNAEYRRDFLARICGTGIACSFNVHRAREHARSLIALEAEQAYFEDWTREQGKGPECREPGAFGSCHVCKGCRVVANVDGDMAPAGVWAGYVKRFGVDEDEERWSGTSGVVVHPGEAVECSACKRDDPRGGWPGKLARQWGGDTRAPMGRAYAKLGRRILDALKGQPAWEWCYALTTGVRDRLAASGWAVGEWTWVGPVKIWPMSRHNLRGVLAPIEWSPQVRRRRTDQVMARVSTPDTWLDALGRMAPGSGVLKTVLTDGAELRRTETRVVPRGEHRSGLDPVTPRASVRGYGPYRWAPGSTAPPAYWTAGDGYGRAWLLMPRWRRGELSHAEQRRRYHERMYNAEMDEHRLTASDVL